LRRLPRPNDPNLLVGFETSDDAGVYLLEGGVALVQTVDFFTPIVDDPHLYGQIAAANSLSDVYAMGGRPISALSIVGFPPNGDPGIMEQILRGGLAKMDEARCTVVGGHSIRDDDIKFGYAVTGVIDPRRVWRNVGAQPGDVLLLTKPIGTGVIATALKKGRASPQVVDAAVASMTRLNKDAAEALAELDGGAASSAPTNKPNPGGSSVGLTSSRLPQNDNILQGGAAAGVIHAVTDVTGFGLLGHAKEMAAGSGVSFELDHAAVEYLPGAVEAAREKHLAGGLVNNREWLEGCVEFAAGVAEEYRALLYDPQTSGGLLVAIASEAADAAVAALAKRNVAARRIGLVVAKRSPLITVS
jgi:selenide,water dikinase